MTTLDELAKLYCKEELAEWERFADVPNSEMIYGEETGVREGLRAVLRAVLEAGPQDGDNHVNYGYVGGWNSCNEAWRRVIEEMMK